MTSRRSHGRLSALNGVVHQGNGLLLSPHIDHLFDGGYITFSTDQSLVMVPEVRDSLLDAWGIDAGVRVGDFSREQNAYLDYHRANVFKDAHMKT